MGRLHLVNASSYCVMASSCATRAPRNCAGSAGARRASITVRRAEFMVSRMTMRLRRSGDSVRGKSSLSSRGPRSGFGSAMRHPLHRLPPPTVRDIPTVRPPEDGPAGTRAPLESEVPAGPRPIRSTGQISPWVLPRRCPGVSGSRGQRPASFASLTAGTSSTPSTAEA